MGSFQVEFRGAATMLMLAIVAVAVCILVGMLQISEAIYRQTDQHKHMPCRVVAEARR